MFALGEHTTPFGVPANVTLAPAKIQQSLGMMVSSTAMSYLPTHTRWSRSFSPFLRLLQSRHIAIRLSVSL